MTGLPTARYAEYAITGPSGGFYTLHPLTRESLTTNVELLTGYVVPVPADPTIGGAFKKVPILGNRS